MHRTTTTATLLVTVAVSALTGCVTVQRPTAPGPPPAPPLPAAPHPDGSAQSRVVQAPAREALEMVRPSQHPSPAPTPHRPPLPTTAATAGTPHRPPAAPRPGHARPAPHSEAPPAVSEAIPKNADVCALGRRYGGWQPDSPEARICGSTYGR
ncbi:hypothetical protein ACFOZ0_34240 [Streptomyces yaanensis]|uniref:Lipoprotein n=1 Tax=Streptomyces yaanensis TaxID=1142239 RepID=A0ABV7SPY5_9ACTN|nr:hypothetical protein [Streptomyces sp. CGMCC 4.7035]WNC00523.1 hypothetical protein Q2K21_22050 [Streptomyces sp. CGMCC 4.7035]